MPANNYVRLTLRGVALGTVLAIAFFAFWPMLLSAHNDEDRFWIRDGLDTTEDVRTANFHGPFGHSTSLDLNFGDASDDEVDTDVELNVFADNTVCVEIIDADPTSLCTGVVVQFYESSTPAGYLGDVRYIHHTPKSGVIGDDFWTGTGSNTWALGDILRNEVSGCTGASLFTNGQSHLHQSGDNRAHASSHLWTNSSANIENVDPLGASIHLYRLKW